MDKLRVVLLFGGRSSEHSISCATAGGVLTAIDRDRFELIYPLTVLVSSIAGGQRACQLRTRGRETGRGMSAAGFGRRPHAVDAQAGGDVVQCGNGRGSHGNSLDLPKKPKVYHLTPASRTAST